MCVAVLAVRYKTDKPGNKRELITVDSEEFLQDKIKEVEQRPEVLKIRVLRATYDIERVVEWKQTAYVAGVATNSDT